MNYQVYFLTDSLGEIYYVGATTQSLNSRLSQHLSLSLLATHSHKNDWIKSLLIKEDHPQIFLLQEVNSKAEMLLLEKYYIKYFRDQGCNLTNAIANSIYGAQYRHRKAINSLKQVLNNQ